MPDQTPAPLREEPRLSDDGRPFVDPPWNTPLDAPRGGAGIPADATISGMFFVALVAGAKVRGLTLAAARERYTSFRFYPVADLARLLVEAAQLFFPERPLRQSLRALGRAGPDAFLTSTLGRVTLGSTEGVHAAIGAMAGAYELNLRPSRVALVGAGPKCAIVRLDRVHYFLDSHHVGTFEGVLRFAGTQGAVKIASRTSTSADFLLTW
jgi:uncharacterized protein (TIGR02265 family)